MPDILGQAIHNLYFNHAPATLWIHNQYGPEEEMPVDTFLRDAADMPESELLAVNQCRGKVLDIGTGAGSHALLLQQHGFDVTALDISGLAVEVMKARGVTNALEADIFAYHHGQFDTLLLLMNGIGLSGTLNGLKTFLQHAKTLLKPAGQILFDSSDIAYLYEGDIPQGEPYYGQLQYRYDYKKRQTDWFNWLYVDQHTLTALAVADGWKVEILFEDEFDQYLARLVIG